MTEAEEKKFMDEAYEAQAEFYREVQQSISDALKEVNHPSAYQEFLSLTDGCRVTDKVIIVPEPNGKNQNDCYEAFTSIFVDQWSEGDSGDSYAGFIYAKFAEKKWLKIPYDC